MVLENLEIPVDYAAAGLTQTGNPYLTAYRLDPVPYGVDKRPAVIVCPGGAYLFTYDGEAEPVAMQFAANGFQTFVLRYSCAPMPFPGALLELAQAVATVREHAEEWHIDPERIFVLGFSAGGHLASSLGVFWNREFLSRPLGRTAEQLRPRGVIACYPVISSGPSAHARSFEVLLGDRPLTDRETLSLEKQVSPDTPPFFLWHTAADENVSVRNSLLMAEALQQQGISFELHIFPEGPHGLCLSTPETGAVARGCAKWVELAVDWARAL